MNSSAKTTAVSFLAAMALGAAAFMGCSVESGTVNDTDGGTQNNDKDSGSDPDSGTGEETGTPTCASKQQGTFVDATCQACLATSCCTQLKTCYDLPGDEAAGKVDCNEYTTCVDQCGTIQDETERESCYADCDTTAADGVQVAYEAIITCGKTNCDAECFQ
jgi:hypothetical protein